MIGVLLMLTAASPQAAGGDTLTLAREALATGDTAEAVRALRAIGVADSAMSDTALAALFALLWIGRSPRQRAAARHWERQAERIRDTRPTGLSNAAILLRVADAVERRRDTVAGGKALAAGAAPGFGAEFLPGLERWEISLQPWVSGEGVTTLLSAATTWLFAQKGLIVLDGLLADSLEILTTVPGACGRGSLPICVIPDPPPDARWAFRAILARSDSAQVVLQKVRREFDRLLDEPWPFDELAARSWVALEALIGNRGSLARAADRGAETSRDRRTASWAAVLGSEFGGDPAAADQEMRAHPEWYAPLDTVIGPLVGDNKLPPAVFWRTAWPLYLEPYNTRLVVHRARLLLADVAQRLVPGSESLTLYGGTRLVQRGIPLGLVRVDRLGRRVGQAAHGTVVEYIDPRTHETILRLPDRRTASPIPLDLGLAGRDTIALRAPTGYVAADFDAMRPLPHQVVQVLRHGSPEIQFYAELPAPTCRHPAPETGFFLLDERLGLVRRSVDSLRPPIRRERLNLALAPGTYVYSLEMLDRACRAAARARYVLTVRSMDKPFLSDLALATVRGEEVPHRVPASQPIPAVYGLIVEAGAAAGFYWEVYGVERGGEDPDRFTVRLTVVDSKRQRVSVRRLGEVARAAARAHPALDIEYKALAPAGSGPIGMGLSVGLPPEAAGVYLARVEVEDRRTKRRATAERWFYVRPARADGGAR